MEPVYRCPNCGTIIKGKGRFCPVCKKGNKFMKRFSIALFFVILVVAHVFVGCSVLETRAPIAAVGGMEIAFKSTSGAFIKFISNPKLKIDADLRAAILDMIATDAQVFQAMQKAHEAWTNAASSVNVAEVIRQLKAIYDLVMPETTQEGTQ